MYRTMTVVNASVAHLEDIEAAINDLQVLYVDGQEEETRHPTKEAQVQYLSAVAPIIADERDRGFASMYGLVTVSLWSELEAFAEDMAALILRFKPEAWRHERLRKIKLPVSEFAAMRRPELCTRFVQLLQRELQAGRGSIGIAGFEEVFNALGFGGDVDKKVRDTLVEMAAVRNVLVHRSGVADARFRDLCPKFPLKPKRRVEVDHARAVEYIEAVSGYSGTLADRIFADQKIKVTVVFEKPPPKPFKLSMKRNPKHSKV